MVCGERERHCMAQFVERKVALNIRRPVECEERPIQRSPQPSTLNPHRWGNESCPDEVLIYLAIVTTLPARPKPSRRERSSVAGEWHWAFRLIAFGCSAIVLELPTQRFKLQAFNTHTTSTGSLSSAGAPAIRPACRRGMLRLGSQWPSESPGDSDTDKPPRPQAP